MPGFIRTQTVLKQSGFVDDSLSAAYGQSVIGRRVNFGKVIMVALVMTRARLKPKGCGKALNRLR